MTDEEKSELKLRAQGIEMPALPEEEQINELEGTERGQIV